MIFFRKLSDYLALTKPRIVLLFVITGFAALAMEGVAWHSVGWLLWVSLGLAGTAGSANGLNQYLERELDAVMERTRKKRPLPDGRISSAGALAFSLLLGIFSCAILWWRGGILASALSAATIVFYSVIYTLWLKPRTPYNIVIGGAAGAAAPLIAWAAATGTVSWQAWLLFLIICMWTPPHFWSLAICLMEDYKKVSFPMLPVVRGEAVTLKQIVIYSIATAPLPLLFMSSPNVGLLFVVSATLLGYLFVTKAFAAGRLKTTAACRSFFGFSIVYLFALSVLLIADAVS